MIKGSAKNYALFSFGNASGGGFGSSWEIIAGTAYRFGIWSQEMDGESLKLRKLTNLVETLEEMGLSNTLKNRETVLFTNNSASEAAYYAGSSSNEKFFDLVLQVKKLGWEVNIDGIKLPTIK